MPSQISYPKTQDEINISNLEQFYYQDLLNEFKTDLTYNQSLLDIENWVQSNYQYFGAWKNANKVKLAVQRLIANFCYARYQYFEKIYPSPISSDIAFETKDAIINIDSKTVSQSGNSGDFESLFFSPNQASFKHKGFGKALNTSNSYPGMPIHFAIPPLDPLTSKPIFTFFMMYKYLDKNSKFSWYRNNNEPNVKFICIPNGDLSGLFNNDLGIKGAKTYNYKKIPNPHGGNEVFDRVPLTHNFPPNSFKVKVATREGWYIPNLNETWLPWSHDRKKEYTNTSSASTCRIRFNILKKRYDPHGVIWNGVTTWQI
jgi:hypothetical protein